MKKKTTKIKLFFSFALLTLFGSCNDYEEHDDNHNHQNSNLKSYYIKGSAAKKVASKFATHFKKPLKSSGTTFRTTEGITIDYQSILVVENELDHTSYTFKVESSEESETVFQNIAMIEKPDQTITKLITYEMSEEFAARYAADLAPISKFEGTVTIQTIEGEDCCSQSEIVTIDGGGGGDSSGGTTGGSNDGSGNSGGGTSGGWGLGYTSGGSSGTSGTTGGGGSAAGSTALEMCPSGMHVKGDSNCRYTKKESGASNPVLSQRTAAPTTTTTTPNSGTPPEICCIYDIGLYEEAMMLKNCEKLNKLKNDFVFKTKLGVLFQSAKTDDFEKYSVLYTDPTPNIQPGQEDAYDYVDSQGAANATGATYDAFTNAQGVLHSHYVGLNSIFSPDDLQDLYNKMLIPEVTDDFFIGVVSAQGTAYILQVANRQAFIDFGNKYLADDEKIKNFTRKEYKKTYNLASPDKVENEKNFLKMMSELGAGLTLGGTSFSENAQPSLNLFSNLQQKTYNNQTDSVEPFNCN